MLPCPFSSEVLARPKWLPFPAAMLPAPHGCGEEGVVVGLSCWPWRGSGFSFSPRCQRQFCTVFRVFSESLDVPASERRVALVHLK